ncbi:hypothetical protein A8F94_11030 [Bacillus sp. FJAT-27225]|uniref:YlzJ-like family protein n=1 Tax=Bacillus sp. FJAT-27225 TaxID=1743144 RepID=UPI00080C264F|nr:YlzJ-like family protein [Bacillus sp. FJAT-27225]OCA85419.1 hypothetical protein A8F94_11030 [Bacillus sp. FJAT-27225]
MILYTMMPEELIFPPVFEPQIRQIINFQGVPMEIEADGDGYRIVRILSTNPGDFLDSRWAPGSKISF